MYFDLSQQLLARLRRIVTCIGPNQKNQPNLDLYLVRRYKICHFPIVVSYLCIGQNLKNQPNLVLYLVRRSKIFVSVATLLQILQLRALHQRQGREARRGIRGGLLDRRHRQESPRLSGEGSERCVGICLSL